MKRKLWQTVVMSLSDNIKVLCSPLMSLLVYKMKKSETDFCFILVLLLAESPFILLITKENFQMQYVYTCDGYG